MTIRILFMLVLATLLAGSLAGCAATFGTFEPNTQFVFPNSNVKELGPTSASIRKRGLFTTVRPITKDEVLRVYQDALRKVQGANLLINFEQDTTTCLGLFTNSTEFSIRGQAARMVVGKQELK